MDRNYYYYLDKEGRIWHEGTEVTDPRFALLVHRTLQNSPQGLLVRCQGENCFLEVEDVPYVVQNLAFHKNPEGTLQQIDMIFPGGYTESLLPETLWVSEQNVLYCKVRNGTFPARFSRKSLFQLSPYLVEDIANHNYCLELHGKRFTIGQQVPDFL